MTNGVFTKNMIFFRSKKIIWASGEMADTHALGACPARGGGSSPLSPTRNRLNADFCADERGLEARLRFFMN